MSPVSLVTIVSSAARLRAGQATAVQLVEECLDAIARQNGELHAFTLVATAQARDAAARADAEIASGRDRGALHGIPISVKDIIDVHGLPTTAASRAGSQTPATADAEVIGRLRDAGAVLIGKCNLHELAFGTTGEISTFGPTRNPRAPGRMAGGSSSGSAVSVAAGMALASIGTDTGGSIRIPAAMCGVVGLKPTFGELSCDGVWPLARTLDHVGPIGLSSADVALVYEAMRTEDPDPGHAPRASRPDGTVHTNDLLRLGVPEPYFLDRLDPSVRTAFDAAVDRLRAAGGTIEATAIPHAAEIPETYGRTVLTEALSVHADTLRTRPDAISPSVRARLEQGRTISDADYAAAQVMRDLLRREVDEALSGRRALLLPTLPMPAPPSGQESIVVAGSAEPVRALSLRLTQLCDLTGHPAISIPCGSTGDGDPCGLHLIGWRGRTSALLTLAQRYEAAIRG